MVQPHLLCWESFSQGGCNSKQCHYHHKCHLCGGGDYFITCPKGRPCRGQRKLKSIAPVSLWENRHSPLKLKAHEVWLQWYPTVADRVCLLQDFTFGFRILYKGSQALFLAKSLSSVLGMKYAVYDKITKE